MKRSFFSIFVLFLLSFSLYGQTVEKVIVKPDGKIYQSAPTIAGHPYRITVEGTYSMWSEYTDSTGVDAVYIYDVPEAQRKAGTWPEYSTFSVPRWVGDTTFWKAPGYQVKLSDFTGFRIDKEPLPNLGIANSTHTYKIDKGGTGNPFSFQILDSVLNPLTHKMEPKYGGDNCGKLMVTIEDTYIPRDTIIPPTFCDIKTICDADGKVIGLQVSAAIFKWDSTNIHDKQNILSIIDIRQLGLIYNGKFICPEGRECVGDTTKPVSIGILVDRSGSMMESIDSTDQTIKMDASKNSINRFIDNFQPTDSAFVMTFAEDITLDQDWTTNKDLLKSSINNIPNPDPIVATNLYDAILASLDQISKSSTKTRALVILSDGKSNRGSVWSQVILDKIAQKNIPIYIVALGYKPDDLEARQKLDLIASRSLGKVFDVNNAIKLNAVYDSLAVQIRDDECCKIKFNFEGFSCNPNGENFLRLVYTPSGTAFFSQEIKFACTCEITINPPTKPILISPEDQAVNVTINTIFEWNQSEYATLYNLEYSKKSDLSDSIVKEFDVTTATLNLEPGTKYFWRVKARNYKYDSDYSDIWEFTTNAATLDKPILILPEEDAVGVGVPTEFLWHKVNNATRYKLSYSKQSNAPNTMDTITNDTSYINKKLDNPSTYYWKVKAYNDTDTSSWSEQWRFTTKDKVELRKPDNGAVDISDTTEFIWYPVKGSEFYQMQVATNSNFTVKDTIWNTNSNSTTFKIKPIINRNQYYWRVRSINLTDKDTTYWSETWHFTTMYAPPKLKSPTNQSTLPKDSLNPTFYWLLSNNTTKYRFEISKTSDFKAIIEGNVLTDTSITCKVTLEPSTHYYWRVKAINNTTDSSDWCKHWEFTTPPPNGIIDPQTQSINLYPNPTDNKAELSINYNETCDAKISISNAEGKIIKTEPIRILQGANSYVINTKNWNSGSYYITITTPSGYITRELVVAK